MRHCPKDKGKLACREFERDYMSQCPKKFIFDSSLTDQERKEACRRHYEERKPSLKTKPSPEQYCSKNCDAMKKNEFNNGKCTKKTVRQNNTACKTIKKRALYKCKKCSKKGLDVIKKGHKCPN